MNIDPLLRFLRLRGNGSWGVFSSAVEALDARLQPYSLARGLSEHALVEFDFAGGKRWSVTGTMLVNAPLEAGGFATAGWGGTPDRITDLGLNLVPGQRTIHTWSGPVEYTHALRVQPPTSGWPRSWEPTDARKLRSYIPSLGSMFLKCESVEAPRRVRQRLSFRFKSVSRSGENLPTKWVEMRWEPFRQHNPEDNALWQVGFDRFVLTRKGKSWLVPGDLGRWLAFREWLARNGVESGISYDEGQRTLTISAQPALPIPYVRVFLLNGAREDSRVTDRLRVFRNVNRPLCDWFTDLLGLNVG